MATQEAQIRNFKFFARDLTGEAKEGLKRAFSSNDVIGWLRDQGLTPVTVVEIEEKKEVSEAKRAGQKTIKSGELAALAWQLNTMVEGGIPIITAMDTIADDIENPALEKVLKQICEKMQKGHTFSECLGEYPRIFNHLARSIVLAGETSGNIAAAFQRLAEYYDNKDTFVKKVRKATVYPAFVFIFIIIITIIFMAFLIPKFTIIFDQLGGDLPAFTKGFMAFYYWMRANYLYVLGTVLFIGISLALINRTKGGHVFFSRAVLKIPLIGKIVSQAFVVVFCKTMSTLISSGISILEAMDILASMTGNDIIRTAIQKTKQNVIEGATVSSSLHMAGFFPPMVSKMIQVGEESGALAKVLDRTAAYYERKVDALITTMLTLLEPIMIVVVGMIVLVVLLALYLPVFTMS